MNILSRAWPRLSSQQENQPALGSFLSPLFHLIPSRIRHISPMLSSSFLLFLPTHPFVTAVHAFSHVLVAGSSSFSHLSRRSTPLSLSSPVVNAVSVFRVAYIHIYLLQLLSYPSFPLCSVALERQPRSIRFQETWKNEFGERDSSISVSTRGAPWASVNEWDIVNGIDDQNGTIIAVAIIRPRSSINNTPSPPLYNHESWYL